MGDGVVGKSDWGLEIIVLERCPWEENLPWLFLLLLQQEEESADRRAMEDDGW